MHQGLPDWEKITKNLSIMTMMTKRDDKKGRLTAVFGGLSQRLFLNTATLEGNSAARDKDT